MVKRSILLPLAALLAAGGCSTGPVNRSLEPLHQPVVSQATYSFDVATGARGLAPGEAARLVGWLQSLRVGYGDHVAVDDPQGSAATRDDVARAVGGFGLLLADAAPVTQAPLTPGAARVVVSRTTASVPGCPDWSRMNEVEISSSTGSNFGCATNSDLAAMVADPADLVRGAPGVGTADPAVASKAIDGYRKAAPTGNGGLKAESVGGN